ncbi:hypothetical protein FOA43_004663 [Brettanomyces nanus]|uniref:Fibronectin type-III domain-containing protein n=1 Tax=Eeniella nana TaxID=13502 RepID=A0A875SB56_EENNA|nr:uncharacterized protein FOA43_004663 [Brettanomyces nanus]QPG77255.1 hypothetical protein FOA43_004663 [Brettanomyces nanus]
MIISLFLAFIGLLWLVHRVSVLLSVKVDKAVKVLNVSVPSVPLISVDKVTYHSIVLHWDCEGSNGSNGSGSPGAVNVDSENPRDNPLQSLSSAGLDGPPLLSQASPASISHFVLYINGLEASVVDGAKQSCTLEGLNPNTNYEIDLVAFNMANFRSRSSPIFVKTASSAASGSESNTVGESGTSLDHPDVLLRALVPNGSRASQLMVHEAFRSRSRSSAIDGSSNLTFEPFEPIRTAPNLITDINELKFLLESGLDEVRSLMKSYREAEQEFKDEEANLVLARNEARQRRRIEDSNRANIRQEIKYLEEQRMKTENRLSADRTKLALRLKKMEQKQNQIASWRIMTNEMQHKRSLQGDKLPKLQEERVHEIQDLNKDVFSLQAEVHGLDSEIKSDLTQKKPLDLQKQEIVLMLSLIEQETDLQTGLVKPAAEEELQKLFKLKPEWQKELTDEVCSIDKRSEAEWRGLQKKEFQKIEKLKRQMDELNELNSLSVAVSGNAFSSMSNTVPSPSYSASQNWSESSSDMNHLLPQNLIDADDISQVQVPQVLSRSLDASQAPSAPSSATGSAASPGGGIGILSGGVYSDINSPMDYPITSLGVLASNASNFANGNIVGSPQSLRATPLQPTDSVISSSFLDMNSQTSPFATSSIAANAGTPMEIALSSSLPGSQELDDATKNLSYNRRSVFDGFSTIGSNVSNRSIGNSPSHKEGVPVQFSNLFSTLSQESAAVVAAAVSADGASVANTTDYGKSSLELISRARSTSFGSSIWSNNNTNAAAGGKSMWGNSLGVLGTPIAIVGSNEEMPQQKSSGSHRLLHGVARLKTWGTSSTSSSSDTVEENNFEQREGEEDGEGNSHQSSPSFFRSKIFKFGTSPTKTATKSSDKSNIAITLLPEEPTELHGIDNKSNSGSSSGHLGSGFGSRSSRFFKLGSRKASLHPQSGGTVENSNATGQSGNEGMENASSGSNGSMFSRKLNFGFKRDKDKVDRIEEE